VYGVEQKEVTVPIAKMNLALHGLSGDIRQANSYYEDPHSATGQFDFVMANPPFNVDKVDKEKLKDDLRFPFGMPRSDNANYLWIQLFYSSLNATGRAGFVMANSAADARQSEMEIRKALLQAHAVDVMVAIGPNFFYTVTLPCTLWFFDKGKASLPASGSPRPGTPGRGVGGEGPRRRGTIRT
jgi:type I restriction enzyme M protein